MVSRNFSIFGLCVMCTALLGCERQISFSNDVQPILTANCVVCHSGTAEGSSASGLSLADYDGVMRGTRFGPVITPNSGVSSNLYLVVAHKTSQEIHMPPHGDKALAQGRGTPLSENEIEVIRTWIDQGAQNN